MTPSPLRSTFLLASFVLLLAVPAVAGHGPLTGPAAERVEVVAGSGDVWEGEPATAAALAGVGGLVVDKAGNVYFSEIGRARVRRVDAETGILTTIAGTGGVETSAQRGEAETFDLFTPGPLALDDTGKVLFIGEVAGRRVLAVELASGKITDLGAPERGFRQLLGLLSTKDSLLAVDTVAGQVWRYSGPPGAEGGGWQPTFERTGDFPGGIRNVVRDGAGNLFLSEFFAHRLLRWDNESGEVSVIAGKMGTPGRSPEGTIAKDALLRTPDGLVLDGEGNLFFSDMNNHRIAKIDRDTGELSTLFESRVLSGDRWAPGSLFLDHQGRFWVGDAYKARVLRFTPSPEGAYIAEVIAGGGTIGDGGAATAAVLGHPGCVALDDAGNLYIADAMYHRVRRVDAESGRIETIAGTGLPGYNGDDIPANQAQLNYPGGLLVAGGKLFIGDYYSNRVRAVDLASGTISTVAGNGNAGAQGNGGPAQAASMLNPHALTMGADGRLIVTSAVAQSVRTIDLEKGVIDAVHLDPRMVPPRRVLVFYDVERSGDGFYLADGMRDQVLYVEGDKVSTVVSRPDVKYPMGLAVSPAGELFISDTRNNRVVRWSEGGIEVVVANLGRPRGIAFDGAGNLYIADTFHNQVLRIPGLSPPPAGEQEAAAGEQEAAAGEPGATGQGER